MLIKQFLGNNLVIGGKIEELKGIYYSLYNNAVIHGDIIELSKNWGYFLVHGDDNKDAEEKYIDGRARNLAPNWSKLFWKSKNGKLIYKLAKIKAKKELDSIKWESFLTG